LNNKSENVTNISELIKNIIAPGERALYSPKFDNIVNQVLDETFENNWRSDKTFLNKIQAEFRKQNFSTYDEDYFSAFYAAYYIPNNFYKIQLMLLELLRNEKLNFSDDSIKILDIGASVGTTAWAVYDFFEILSNIYTLYGLNFPKQLSIEVDSIEISKSNIAFFEKIRNRVNIKTSEFININKPIQADVLNGGFGKVVLDDYDIIFASNVICEFPNYTEQKKFADQIVNNQKQESIFIIIETAILKDTKMLKRLQYDILQNDEISLISPCGKIAEKSERCQNCWSFRKENLIIPSTMKLFSQKDIKQDDNAKLKWSYSIFSKSVQRELVNLPEPNIKLSKVPKFVNKTITINAEIISMKINIKNESNYNYYHICDQSENTENTILKVPNYFILPNYNFGDILRFSDILVEKDDSNSKPKFSLTVNPHKTIIENWSQPNSKMKLIEFKNIKKENLEFFLFRFFKYNKFKDGQYNILKKILSNQSVLGVLATGGGKSLIFQLAALLKPGVTLVVSPLKSLMDDQIFGLKNRYGFDFADRIHSGMNLSEKKYVISRFRNGYLKLLYVAPERLQQKSFQKVIARLVKKGININYFTIDEAHCISEWGHDFRHSYARLKERQSEIGSNPPISALTATASHLVRKDIINFLKMNDKKDLIWQINDRQELSLEVIPLNYSTDDGCYSITFRGADNNFQSIKFDENQNRPDLLQYLLENILKLRFDHFDPKEHSGQIFTIYADPKPAKSLNVNIPKLSASQKLKRIESQNREYEGARWLADYLKDNGYNCKAWYSTPGYRDDLTSKGKKKNKIKWEEEKTKIQNQFINNEFNLLVSTKGFGMGIDKPNIRYVIHYGFPGSLESYFQQIGRAGRDGKHSHCILMWDSPTEKCKRSKEIRESGIPPCFTKQSQNSDKYAFDKCKYGRNFKCDYAKQAFFFESSYPEKSHLFQAIQYLIERAKKQKSFPYIYLKKDYLADSITTDNYVKNSSFEISLFENLYTLKYIEEFNQGYLAVKVKRNKSFEEIFNSTNDEDIKTFINLLEKYKLGSKQSKPEQKLITFKLDKIVLKLREKGIEIMIEELLNSLAILEERDDIELKFNYYQDYGYEIKLNEVLTKRKKIKIEDFYSVYEWKKNQYQMLQTMLKFAELNGMDKTSKTNKESHLCRRSFMMTEFGNKAFKLSEKDSCDFCDVCGYNNDWDQGATDLTADAFQTIFREEVRDFYSNQTKDNEYVYSHFDDYCYLIKEMLSKEFNNMIEIISTTWLEQSNESNNPATNLTLAIINYIKKDFETFDFRIDIVIKVLKNSIPFLNRMILFLIEILDIDIFEFYSKHFKNKKIDHMFKLLTIFNSNDYQSFSVIEKDIMIFTHKLQIEKYYKIMKKY
jgi:superfamily II DNA helicase RecQ